MKPKIKYKMASSINRSQKGFAEVRIGITASKRSFKNGILAVKIANMIIIQIEKLIVINLVTWASSP